MAQIFTTAGTEVASAVDALEGSARDRQEINMATYLHLTKKKISLR